MAEDQHHPRTRDRLILIFVKHPIPGQVKTRLGKSIGMEKAAEVYQHLLAYTRDIVLSVPADKAVFYGNIIPETDLWKQVAFDRILQEGQNLGERMKNAFQWGFQKSYQKILVIGSDCVQLTSQIIEQAFLALEEKDIVIGPAVDGGYYLLGMNTLHPDLFKNKSWSTSSVLSDTLIDIQNNNRSFSLLEKLSDIDTIEDLKGTFLEKWLQNTP